MKPIAIDDFCRFKFLSNVTFSPEGKSASFVVTTADQKKNGYRSCIYMRKDGKIKKLTNGGKERSFQYLDENTLLFPGMREADADAKEPDLTSRYYKISLNGGEAELAYTFPIPVSKVLPLENGNLLLLGQTLPGFEDLYTGDRKKMAAWKQYTKENADYEEITQVPWWWNGATYTKGVYESLFYYDAKKKALHCLTGLNENITGAELGPDGKTVYYLKTPVEPRLKLDGTASLCRMDLRDDTEIGLVSCSDTFEINGFAIGKSFLLVLASDKKYGLNTDVDFYKLNPENGDISLYKTYGEAIGTSVGTDIRYDRGKALRMDGDVCYFISTRFDSAGLYKLEDGEISAVSDQPGSVECFDVRNGQVLMSALLEMRGQELYLLKAANHRKISSFNDVVVRGRYVAKPEILNVDRGEYEIHGFVLKPMDYDPAKKYPVIFDIHGGPKTVYGPVFYHEMQYWAGKGYFVIFCNPTGSDGRGEFMDIRGKYGTVDYEDLMAFCDAALENYPAMDPEHLYETGGSYGGFMTNWIIGHTDRFRACASQRSISNWLSFYGVSDIGVDFVMDQIAADPWEDPEKLWQHSPMKYADKVKTPTLFIHSFEDYRCPIDQGYQMFTSLIAHGVESRMVCFRGENHELSRSGKPLHRIKRLKVITEWFENHR